VELGPQVVLDQERCILCLRCTRFLDEISKTSELGVYERGDRAFIDLAPGKRLDNVYSGNVVDICPVGALTNRDFRFQARVWYLKRTESVCAFCANGCNIEIHHREGRIHRFRPRLNAEVNDYWMCDEGRMGYHRIQGENRVVVPQLRQGESFRAVGWKDATAAVASGLRGVRQAFGDDTIAGIVSAFATNEEAHLFRLLLGAAGTGNLAGYAWSPPDAYGDDFLVKRDKNPNTRGLAALGISTSPEAVEAILEDARTGHTKALVVFGADLVGQLGREKVETALEALNFFVLIDIARTETSLYADVLLPAASFAETDGTFVNHRGRVQRIRRAFSPAGQAMEGWELLASLLQAVGDSRTWNAPEAAFAEIAAATPAFSGLDYAALGLQGKPLSAP